MENMFGNGQIRIEFAGLTLDFELSQSSIIFEPIIVERTNRHNVTCDHIIGYTQKVNVEIWYVEEYNIDNFRNLLYSFRNTELSDIYKYTITPKYDSDITNYSIPNMAMVSDISLIPLSRLNIGEKISLEFVAQDFVTEIPLH